MPFCWSAGQIHPAVLDEAVDPAVLDEAVDQLECLGPDVRFQAGHDAASPAAGRAAGSGALSTLGFQWPSATWSAREFR